jgi:hypothetical protein
MRIPLTSTTGRRFFRWKFQQRCCQSLPSISNTILALKRSRTPYSVRRLARRRTQLLFKRTLLRAAHAMGPTVVALAFAGAAKLAHGQGTISFSGAQTLMQTVQTFAEYAGAVICLIGLIFAGVSFMSGNIQRGVVGLFGAIFGAAVLGWGAGWISSLTGQSVN